MMSSDCDCDDHASSQDNHDGAHLPLHVGLDLRVPAILATVDSTSMTSSSACTNPHLRQLMERYFHESYRGKDGPKVGFRKHKEDIENGYDSDAESDADGLSKLQARNPRSKSKRRKSRRRKRSSDALTGPEKSASNNFCGSINSSRPEIDLDAYHQFMKDGYRDHKDLSNNHNHVVMGMGGTTTSIALGGVALGSASFDGIADGVHDEKDSPPPKQILSTRLNAWDSSPSTVCEEDRKSLNVPDGLGNADENAEHSFGFFFNPIDEEEGDYNYDPQSSNLRKHLFSVDGSNDDNDDDDAKLPHPGEIRRPLPKRQLGSRQNIRSKSLADIDPISEDDSDLELTQRSRELQYHLRLQQMIEIALEAERAAEAGEETFAASATRFELGLGLDVPFGSEMESLNGGDYSPPRSCRRLQHHPAHKGWAVCAPFDCGRPEYIDSREKPAAAPTTPPRDGSEGYGYGDVSNANILPSRFFSNRQLKSMRSHPRMPQTEMIKRQRPSPLSRGSRQVSAPTMLQTHRRSGSYSGMESIGVGIPATPISAMPSILTSRTFLSVAPPPSVVEKPEKVPVLSLRHMEDLIPSFSVMHNQLKLHMSTNEVEPSNLSSSWSPSPEKKDHRLSSKEEQSLSEGPASTQIQMSKDTASSVDDLSPGTKSSSNLPAAASFLTKVPSFQMIMKSVSGMSGSDPAVGKISDEDLSYGTKDSDTNLSLASVIPMDCVSFVSCGERSDKMILLTPERKEKKQAHFEKLENSNSLLHDNGVDGDPNSKIPEDIYACTLATEIIDPTVERQRSLSPPPQAPYSIDECNLALTPRRGRATSLVVQTPRSRWSTFWDNISPSKTAKRNSSLPTSFEGRTSNGLSMSMPPTRKPIFVNSHQEEHSTILQGIKHKSEARSFSSGDQIAKTPYLPSIIKQNSSSQSQSKLNEGILSLNNEITPFYLRPLSNNGIVNDWDIQTNESNDSHIISSRSYSQKIPNSKSPIWSQNVYPNEDVHIMSNQEDKMAEDNGSGCILISQSYSKMGPTSPLPPHIPKRFGTVDCDGSKSEEGKSLVNQDQKPRRKVFICEEKKQFSPEDEISGKASFKGSFRTSTTTQLSDADDESYSDLSHTSESNLFNTDSSLSVFNVRSMEASTSRDTSPLHNESSSQTGECVARDQDSASDKPPLHPAGVKLANILLNKSSSFKTFQRDRAPSDIPVLPTIEASRSCNDLSDHYSDDSSSKQQSSHEETSNKCPESPPKLEHSFDLEFQAKHSDTDISHDESKSKVKNASTQSFGYWLNHGYDKDGQSFCSPFETNLLRERSNSKATVKSLNTMMLDVESDDDGNDNDDNNTSTLTFSNLLENVPSVISKLTFRKSGDSERTYRDEEEFVENFMYTGIKSQKSKPRCFEDEDNICRRKQICGKGTPRCADFSCPTVVESALMCLSVQNSESNDISYELNEEPSNTTIETEHQHSNSSEIELDGVSAYGDFLFRGPSLKIKRKGQVVVHDICQTRSYDSCSIVL
mmetsp:Transcript_9809/g.14722  ORF Transcript_9809/g.14722 Transcript_9809/m.14722 type:complete len:1502 (+) Transcript_9809:52-4557(+)